MGGSVLETFWILFDSDASKVKKGAQEAETATEGLSGKLLSAEEISNALGASFMNMAKQAALMFGGLFAAERAIGGAFENAEWAKHVSEAGEALGISTKNLGAWSDAIKHIGGSAEGAIDSIRALSGSLAQVDATGHSRVKPFFDELGIKMQDSTGKTKKVTQLLWELSGAFEHMSKQESFGFGRKMQLDEGMIRLLQRGQSGLKGLIDQMHALGDIQDEDAEAAKQWAEFLDNVSHSMRTTSLGITTELLPALVAIGKAFEDNRDIIDPIIGTLISSVGLLIARLAILRAAAVKTLVVGELGEIVAWLGLMNDALRTGTVLTWLGLAPWLAITAAILGAGYAVYELLNNWKDLVNFTSKLFGGSNVYDMNVDHNLEGAKQKLASADHNPLGWQTSQSISNSAQNFKKETNISIGEITVHTQATSAGDVAKDIAHELQRHFRQTVNDSDDGQAI